MKYLLRHERSGFLEKQGEPLDDQLKPLRPFALTPDGRVVYSEWDWQKRTFNHAAFLYFKEYDKSVSLTRRREFETALAKDANAHPECVKKAIDLVTLGLKAYVGDRADDAGGVVKTRCYNDTGSGRLGSAGQGGGMTAKEAWESALTTMEGADLPKILGIQTAIANVMSKKVAMGTNQKKIYDDTANKIAPSSGYLYDWFTDDSTRGRQRGTGAQPTSTPGVTSPGLVTKGGEEERKRGIDEWARVEGSAFVKGIDLRNLAFGAGRSGTTGELLKTFRTFGSTDTGEMFKQYLLAIVIYLVGGGHHSCHEIFSVANLLMGSYVPQGSGKVLSASTLAREAYVPGKYINHLPDSYMGSNHFEILKEKYYDIAMIGHLHATFT